MLQKTLWWGSLNISSSKSYFAKGHFLEAKQKTTYLGFEEIVDVCDRVEEEILCYLEF